MTHTDVSALLTGVPQPAMQVSHCMMSVDATCCVVDPCGHGMIRASVLPIRPPGAYSPLAARTQPVKPGLVP